LAAVSTLGSKKKGLSRNELVKAIGYTDGSKVSAVLNDLELSGFIRRYNAFPRKKNGSLYQLVDQFSLFWLSFLYKGRPTDPHFWSGSPVLPGAEHLFRASRLKPARIPCTMETEVVCHGKRAET
jgi:hypothetical protein